MKRRAFLALLLCGGLLVTTQSQAKPKPADAPQVEPPSAILIIRHAEKPDNDKDIHLSEKGQKRAEALVHAIPRQFTRPDFIFATHKSKMSDRPVETVTPLAKEIKEAINDTFTDDEYKQLAHKILTDPQYSKKVVLICWHHGKIPELAKALGAADLPDWNKKVFDRVWEITFKDGKAKWSDRAEKALPGDSQD